MLIKSVSSSFELMFSTGAESEGQFVRLAGDWPSVGDRLVPPRFLSLGVLLMISDLLLDLPLLRYDDLLTDNLGLVAGVEGWAPILAALREALSSVLLVPLTVGAGVFFVLLVSATKMTDVSDSPPVVPEDLSSARCFSFFSCIFFFLSIALSACVGLIVSGERSPL